MLSGKKIILGVSGSIAAYKAVYLLRLLQKAGAEVKVVCSPAVNHFVGELTFSGITGSPVFSGLWEANWSQHVELGTWADLMIIAPATANTLAKCAQGLCDNALNAVFLAARCPVIFAPAMDADMYIQPAVQRNIQQLQQDGYTVLPTGIGYLASGLEGPGRLLEPEEILQELLNFFGPKPLEGKKLMITAGPTREAIDPVRFITNHSTGKMGYAIAEKAALLGAEVRLISGPTNLPVPPNVHATMVNSAEEMFNAVKAVAHHQHILIMSAAVSDYTPKEVAQEKIKKGGDDMQILLKRTTDILKHLGAHRTQEQLLVGFALETNNEKENAQKKLLEKKLDLIILNSLKDPGAGFGHDTNKVCLMDKDGNIEEHPLKSKKEVAADILQKIIQMISK